MDANQNPGASLDEAPGEQDIQTGIPIRLTLEEIALLELLAEGFPYQEIAPRLAVSRATLKRRVRHVVRKLGARNRTQAAVVAVRRGVI